LGTITKAGIGKWIVAAVLAASLGTAQAGGAEDEAVNGAVADGLTTALGLAAGAVELNPVGPVLAIGMKVAVLEYAKSLPETDRPRVYAAAASMWQGAAANNLCIAASLLSGGAFVPACVALGFAWGVKTWKASEPERQFWEACKLMREDAHQPDLTCIYVPPTHPSMANVGPPVTTALVQRETP